MVRVSSLRLRPGAFFLSLLSLMSPEEFPTRVHSSICLRLLISSVRAVRALPAGASGTADCSSTSLVTMYSLRSGLT
eukprot:scaffold57215_cov45-Phaeocystis_antarctica.AAC.1